MKVTVLGCWAPYAKGDGACTGFLVESEHQKMLLDCGNGTFGKLQKHINFRELTGIVISHFHPDHYADLWCLRHALKGSLADGSRSEKLDLWMPSEPWDVVATVQEWQDVFVLHPLETMWEPLVLGDLRWEFHPAQHSPVTYATKVTALNGATLVYSADTAWDEELIKWSQGASTLLVEASLQEKDAQVTRVGHLTAAQAGQWGQVIGASQLVLTHLWPEYDEAETARQANIVFGQPVTLAANIEYFAV